MAPLLLSTLGSSTAINRHCVQSAFYLEKWWYGVRLWRHSRSTTIAFSNVLLLFVTHSLALRFIHAALAVRPTVSSCAFCGILAFVSFFILRKKSSQQSGCEACVLCIRRAEKKWSVPQCNESVLENVFQRHWSEWQNINTCIHARQVRRVQVAVVVVPRVNAAKGKAEVWSWRSENVVKYTWTYVYSEKCTFNCGQDFRKSQLYNWVGSPTLTITLYLKWIYKEEKDNILSSQITSYHPYRTTNIQVLLFL